MITLDILVAICVVNFVGLVIVIRAVDKHNKLTRLTLSDHRHNIERIIDECNAMIKHLNGGRHD